MTTWPQQRPEWCPHPTTCAYRLSSQACICVGELDAPRRHDGDHNTHRLCMTQSCEGDEPWKMELEINRGDAAGIVRVLSRAFGLGGGA